MSSPARNRIALVAVWLVGSTIAIAVAVAAIGLAGSRVTGHTEMLRARDTADRTVGAASDPILGDATSVVLPPDGPLTGAPGGTGGETPTSGSAAPAPGRSDGQPGSSPGAVQAPEANSNPSPEDAPTTTRPASTPTTAPSMQNHTTVVGGTVTVQCINSSVSLVSAVPNDRYSKEVGNKGPEQVEVQFNSEAHESHVTATCRAGVITFSNQESGGGA
jgi:hypothetical protein